MSNGRFNTGSTKTSYFNCSVLLEPSGLRAAKLFKVRRYKIGVAQQVFPPHREAGS